MAPSIDPGDMATLRRIVWSILYLAGLVFPSDKLAPPSELSDGKISWGRIGNTEDDDDYAATRSLSPQTAIQERWVLA